MKPMPRGYTKKIGAFYQWLLDNTPFTLYTLSTNELIKVLSINKDLLKGC